jgi:phage gp29-like protein
MVDEMSKSGSSVFKYDLMESKGTSKYDTSAIIKAYQQDILTALNVDILRLGADGGGSFSLAEAKTSVLALAIDSKLKEIQSVLNQDLMRDLYEYNGWDLENMAKFTYSDIEEIDINDFSAAIQRMFAVGALEIDREVMNKVRKVLGVSERPDDEPVNKDELSTNMTGAESSSGQGLEVGSSGNGTAKIGGSASGRDNSVANKENSP